MCFEPRRKRFDARHVGNGINRRQPTGARDSGQIGDRAGHRRLHAGFGIVLIVEHDDRKVLRRLHRDHRQRAKAHQHVAVAGDDRDRAVRLRHRQTQAHRHRAAHAAPEVEVAVVVAGGRDIVGRRAEPGDNQQILAVGQQARDDGAAVECRRAHFAPTVKGLRPIRRCDSNTAAPKLPSKAIRSAASTVAAASSGSSAR